MTGDDRPLISLGVDIGKTAHYAVAVDRQGHTVYSKPVANEESGLRLLVLWLVHTGQWLLWISRAEQPRCC